MAYTEEELSLLSQEERDAIVNGQDNPDHLKAIAGEEEPDDDEGGAGDENGEAEDKGATGEEDGAKKPAAEAEDKLEEQFTPQFKADPVDDYDGKMAAFATQKADLRKRYQEGDIDLDQYEQGKDSIVAHEVELREQQFKANLAAEQSSQAAVARWEWEQERFFSSPANKMYEDKLLLSAFDTAVRSLGNDAANATRSQAWFLEEADRQVRARFNMAEKQDPKPVEKKQTDRKPDLSLVPKTLGALPAAEIAQPGGVDEFAHIDRLTGLELENAVARLSPAERERYRAA